MTAVEQAREEIVAALAEMAPVHEGLRDYSSLNLSQGAHDEVAQMLVAYDRRYGLLVAAQGALDTLIAEGYPSLPAREIDQAEYADLQANLATIQAALEQFVAVKAQALGMQAGAPEAKS